MKVKNTVLQCVICLLGIIYIFGFYYRSPNFDEAIIAEWAYWIANIGIPKSVLYTPMGGGTEIVIYVYHKLIAWCAAIIISVFGMELLPLRIFILSFLFVLLFSFRKYTHQYIEKSAQKRFLLISALLLLFFTLVFKLSFTFRPEIMITALGFLSFLFLLSSLNSNNFYTAIIAGVFAGLSFLTHLNGIAYLIAGFIFLIINKKYKLSIFYSLAASLISIFIFADDISVNAIPHFIAQLQASPDTTSSEFVWYGPFLKILNEHQRFFHSPVETSLSILLVLSLLFTNKNFRVKHKYLLQYMLLLIIFLGSLTHGKTSKYLLLITPYMVLIITHYIFENGKQVSWKRYMFNTFLILYFIIQAIFIGKQFKPHHSAKKYGANILSQIPVGSNVFGSSNLVFAGVDKYILHSKLTFEFISSHNNIEKNLKNYLKFAFDSNEEFVVFTQQYTYERYWNEIQNKKLKLNDIIFDYKVYAIQDEFVILCLNQ